METPEIYTQVCSARTVQSDKNGFFSEFIEEAKNCAGEKWLKNYFGKLKSDEARILSIFNDQEICDTVIGVLDNVRPVFRQKDEQFSSQRRLQAEKHFLIGEYQKALMLINQAVIRAPSKGTVDNGITLALALWTRTNILLELGDGENVLKDLKMATFYGFNTKQNVEYYYKMAKAYALMGENVRANITMGIIEKLASGNDEKIKQMKKEIEAIVPTERNTSKPLVAQITGGLNPDISSVSAFVTLSENVEKGKHITASNELKTGDTVMIEQPIASCLSPDFYCSHCCHCFKRLVVPIACGKCAGMAFCSMDCMEIASKTYHKYECEFSDLFIGSGMSILCYIALRVFTQAKSVDDGLSAAFDLITNLCTHGDKRTSEDFLHRSLMAGFLLRCLQKSEYFGVRATEAVNPTSKEIKVASALLGLLQVLQFNAHEIFETMMTEHHRFDGSRLVSVGAGIYRTGSYFNHDCCPGLARYFHGKTIVLTCTRPFHAGETVNENYGPIFTKFNLKDRQRALKGRYMFECTCTACKENWPTLQKLDKTVRFKCPTKNCGNCLRSPKDTGKSVKCAKCKKNIPMRENILKMERVEDLYSQGALAMKNQQTTEAIECFTEGINLFFQIAFLPHKDTLIAQESLRMCLTDTGTTFVREKIDSNSTEVEKL